MSVNLSVNNLPTCQREIAAHKWYRISEKDPLFHMYGITAPETCSQHVLL